MKNKILHNLNFNDLLDYPADFQPQHYYDKPIPCSRFCIECEESGVLALAGGKLTLMSHGCDTSDFEKIIGPKENKFAAVQTPIMFLLEDPGGDYDLGKELLFNGVMKKPPVNHYYFSTGMKSWPQSIEDVIKEGNYYGSYFAYVMQRHSLSNVYITNLVKCKRIEVKQPHLVEEKCVSRFLEKEITEFSPSIVFCFGGKVFSALTGRFPNLNCLKLYHPSFIQNRSYTQGMSPSEAMAENDRRIEEQLNKHNAI